MSDVSSAEEIVLQITRNAQLQKKTYTHKSHTQTILISEPEKYRT
jgi:hypothetical protein